MLANAARRRLTPGIDSDDLIANTVAYLVERNAILQADFFLRSQLFTSTVDYENYPVIRRKIWKMHNWAMTKFKNQTSSDHSLEIMDQLLAEGLIFQLLESKFNHMSVDIETPLKKVLTDLDNEYNRAKGEKAEAALGLLIAIMPTKFAEMESYCNLVLMVRGQIIHDSPLDRLPEKVARECPYITWENQFKIAFYSRFGNNPNVLALVAERPPQSVMAFKNLCKDLNAGFPAQKFVFEYNLPQLIRELLGKAADRFISFNSAQTTPSRGKHHRKKKSKMPSFNQ